MDDDAKKGAYESLEPHHQGFVDDVALGLPRHAAYYWNVHDDGRGKARTNRKPWRKNKKLYDQLRSNASRLVAKDNVKEAFRERCALFAMSREEALQRLGQQASNEQMDYLNYDGTIDLKCLIRDGKAHLVKETDYKGKDADRLVIRFYPVDGALDKILKAYGAFNHRQQTEDVSVDMSDFTREELQRVATGESPVAVKASRR